MRNALTLPCLTLIALLTPAHKVLGQNYETVLEPDIAIEGLIGPKEVQTFTVRLSEKQYLQLVVDQHGIDLIVRVYSPAGKNLGEFDTPNGSEGPENASIVALASGTYRMQVSPLHPEKAKAGKFEIRIIEVRDATEQELKVGANEEVRKAKGLALLNQVVDSIPEIRQPQTRINAKLQSAALLWFVDEKKSARLLTEVVTDAKTYLAGLKPDSDSFEDANQWVRRIRFEAIQTLAFHDPEAALNLMRSTREGFIGEYNNSDRQQESQFELSLASRIATKNPKRAFEIAEKLLEGSFPQTLLDTMMELRIREKDLAQTLAKDTVEKLLETRIVENPDATQLAMSLIQNGRATPNQDNQGASGDLPLLSNDDYKALVQKLLTESLSTTNASYGPHGLLILQSLKMALGSQLDTIYPGATAAIQKRLADSPTRGMDLITSPKSDKLTSNSSGLTLRDSIAQLPPEVRLFALQQLIEQDPGATNLAEAIQVIKETITNPRQRKRALDSLERRLAETAFRIGDVREALNHARNIESLPERTELLGTMVSRIGPGYKRAEAIQLLESARNLLGVEIQVTNEIQMKAMLNLGATLSRYDAKRGFEIVEPLVSQFNELIEAARTLKDFGQQYFFDGELLLQNGNSLGNSVEPLAESLGVLSLTDFDRAKITSDQISLPEVRFPVYLAIARQAIVPNGIYSPSAVYWNSLNR